MDIIRALHMLFEKKHGHILGNRREDIPGWDEETVQLLKDVQQLVVAYGDQCRRDERKKAFDSVQKAIKEISND